MKKIDLKSIANKLVKPAGKKPAGKKTAAKKAPAKKVAAKKAPFKFDAKSLNPKNWKIDFKKQSTVKLIGWVLIGGGTILLGSYAYENVIQNWIQTPQQQEQAKEFESSLPTASADPLADPAPIKDFNNVPFLAKAPKAGKIFATMRIPRYGADWKVSVAEGVDPRTVLDTIGIGHYSSTQMPGERGNFAVAAHRTTHGKPFNKQNRLKKGDKIYVETKLGTYMYVFDSKKIVRPNEVWVIAPTPSKTNKAPKEFWLTMTTCHPKGSDAYRLIAWAKLVGFSPRVDTAKAATSPSPSSTSIG